METQPVWLPLIEKDMCIGCGDCLAICPTDALVLLGHTAVLAHPDVCNYCGGCETICPVEAISLPYQIVLAYG